MLSQTQALAVYCFWLWQVNPLNDPRRLGTEVPECKLDHLMEAFTAIRGQEVGKQKEDYLYSPADNKVGWLRQGNLFGPESFRRLHRKYKEPSTGSEEEGESKFADGSVSVDVSFATLRNKAVAVNLTLERLPLAGAVLQGSWTRYFGCNTVSYIHVSSRFKSSCLQEPPFYS
jgi:hypothetical protein